jgi:hypothetical protein
VIDWQGRKAERSAELGSISSSSRHVKEVMVPLIEHHRERALLCLSSQRGASKRGLGTCTVSANAMSESLVARRACPQSPPWARAASCKAR